MSGAVNKVDMSLDDIIKLNKKNKKGVSPMNRAQQGNARNSRKGNTLKNLNNDKIPGRYSGVNKKAGAGGVTKNNNNAILQRKRLNALKKLREAKQALALIDAKKKTYGKLRNQPQKRLPPQNRQQNNKRNFNTLSPNQGQKRPRINRNYGSQASLNQFNSPMKKKKFTASTISLGPVGSTNKGGYQRQSRNNQTNNTRRLPRQNSQNQWKKQSIDNGLTVQVNNNRIRQNRNRRNNNNKFNTRNLKVQQGKHRNYDFDTNVFSNVGTSVPLNERFSNKGQKQYQGNNKGRQVYY
ncbi:hypothetical protein LOTGIDRAFT_231843 [Lottia gigantea]|uniref:Uncharacterized protein n=1 Tax=Lottia gigantea TaxID=225164 RepID=V4AGU7_LOTGI|nr:hypothetical protein LOTGIDRAFT_231843 [Lottia gigantea]ESO96132.1 hypothetical protein LOTGIDRAFT_231843 [Lottia gigantea]